MLQCLIHEVTGADGHTNDVQELEVFFLQDWLMNDPHCMQGDWRLNDPWCGLRDIGTHAFDLATFLIGQPATSVFGATVGTAGKHGRDVIDNGECSVRFANGVVAKVRFHQALPGHSDDIGVRVKIKGMWYMWRLELGPDSIWTSEGAGDPWDLGRWQQHLRGTSFFHPAINATFGKTPAGHTLGWPALWYYFMAALAGHTYERLGLLSADQLPDCMTLELPTLEGAGEASTRYAYAHVRSAEADGKEVELSSIPDDAV
jgi:predicted dehydrogenase